MAEPRIQYATTSDGVSIAYFTMGEGPPFLIVPPIPWSHVGLELEYPGYRHWLDTNARNKRVIRYDSRGSGLSDRDVDLSDPQGFLLDIDGVADKLGLERFVLFGISIGAPVAIGYAATHPERVSKLILWCAPARSKDVATPAGDAVRVLRNMDWNLFTETAAHAMVAGWDLADDARRWAAFSRETISQESVIKSGLLEQSFDVTEELKQIKCPTLVLHRREAVMPSEAAARYIASRIPDAELVILEGGALITWLGNTDEVIRLIDGFLGLETLETSTPELVAQPRSGGGMVIILFTDIAGSTTLTQRVGDAAAQTVVRAHNTIVRKALSANGGSETKHTGDGIMASFPLASSAIEAAIAIQRAVAAQGVAHPETAFRVRIGLNAGEPVVEEQDMFGTAVQLARRVCDHGEAGSILVTDVVRQLAAGKRYLFSDNGEATLRGFEDPVRLYEVSWR